MDRPNELQLGSLGHEIDAARAAGILCPCGKVVVEMLPAASCYRGLFLPDQLALNMRPDVGIVLAAGPDVSLCPGDMVAVRGYAGQWLSGFKTEAYETENQVRVYGKFTPNLGVVKADSWAASIPLQIFPETEDMVATKNNLIIRREPLVTHDGPFILPDDEQYRTGLAEVLSVGPECELDIEGDTVRVGDQIHYDTNGELEFAFGGDADLAVISDLAVNFVIRERLGDGKVQGARC